LLIWSLSVKKHGRHKQLFFLIGGKDLKKSANQKQGLPVAAMVVNRSGRNKQTL
jgi:hypothetical protein